MTNLLCAARLRKIGLLTSILFFFGFRAAGAADTVTVHLESGRTFTGKVDAQSNDRVLVLRFEGMATTLWRTIDWHRVAGAVIDGRDVTPDEFRRLTDQIKTTRDDANTAAAAESQPAAQRPVPPEGQPQTVEQVSIDAAPTTAPAALAAGRVRSLALDAFVANWNKNVPVDGLVVRIFPQDVEGQLVPVDGTLQVDLIGVRGNAGDPRYSGVRPKSFPRLGHWTQRVEPEHVGPAGAVYVLPFQAIDPQFNWSVNPHALVHARLVVPGEGAFETSDGFVRIRPYSPVRDRLQQAQGKRFFPDENLGAAR